MASLRSCVLRHTLRNPTPFTLYQRRWAQVHDIRFLATVPRSEKVFEKYRDKLDRKAKEIGVNSVDELKKIYQESTSPTKSSSTFPPPPAPPSPATNQDGTPSTNSTKVPPIPSSFGKPSVKTLSSYLDMEKIQELPAREISSIWRLRHASDPTSLCAAMPTDVYRKIENTARRHPQFILPIAREVNPEQMPEEALSGPDGTPKTAVEIHFMQWTFPAENTVTVLFTHLAEYKLRGEYAQPHTTVTHHLELAKDKDLVLLQGQVQEGRGVSVADGQWLLMCLQKFYGMEQKQERLKLLKQFSTGDQSFKIEELVSEAEKIL